MLSAATHRKLARECLDRAYQAPTKERKLNYLRLAVRNTARAEIIEGEEAPQAAARGTQTTEGRG
jgi:hypothetical protein